MKIGVSSYSFSKYMRDSGCDYLKICDLAKEFGFDGIEFIDLEPNALGEKDAVSVAKKIKAYCDKIGLEIAAYTIGANFLQKDIEGEVARLCGEVDVAAALGVSVMRHDVCYELPKKHLYNWQNAIEEMAPYIRRVTEYAKTKGIRTCTENHGYIFQAPERVEALIRAVNNENYGWLVDMGNFMCADADPILAVSKAAPYAFHVHAKDFLFKRGGIIPPTGFFRTAGANYLRGTIVGHGVVPVASCVEILKKAGYDGWLSLEFEGEEECLPAIKSGLDYLRRVV